MGFFSDLKDDLSQAVNELMPEEELEAALAAEGLTRKRYLRMLRYRRRPLQMMRLSLWT